MRLRALHSILILTALLLSGCSAAEVTAVPDTSRVTVGTRPPEGGYQQLGAITATHGGGCGLYGSRGDYEGAHTKLRNKAATLGADYVQIIKVTPPHLEGICMNQAFVIDGLAYKMTVGSAQAAPEPKKPVASFGTGFLIRPDGMLATAYHVIEGATRIEVKCPGTAATTAMAESNAPSNDLAVLRIVSSNLPYLPLAKPRSIRPGDRVFTVGFPVASVLGADAKFSDGSVAGLSGPGGEASLVQITVPIQPGNSGGPLLNEAGEVVGVVTSSAAIRPFLAMTGTLPQNVNWAVKSEYLRPLIDEPVPLTTPTERRQLVDRAIQATCYIRADR
jgi:S1-C subfamily serine protease